MMCHLISWENKLLDGNKELQVCRGAFHTTFRWPKRLMDNKAAAEQRECKKHLWTDTDLCGSFPCQQYNNRRHQRFCGLNVQRLWHHVWWNHKHCLIHEADRKGVRWVRLQTETKLIYPISAKDVTSHSRPSPVGGRDFSHPALQLPVRLKKKKKGLNMEHVLLLTHKHTKLNGQTDKYQRTSKRTKQRLASLFRWTR